MSIDLGMPKPRAMDPIEEAPSTEGRPATGALIDTFGRTARDLRISLTDFCNLRCTYCMPEAGLQFLKKPQLMSVEEVARFVRIGVEELGIREVRFTGGEPLTRNDLADIIAEVAALDPRPDISLTTNAIGLEKRAEGLVAAGLDRINISLDSAHSETFEAMTRRPFLHRVLEGIEAARAAGLSPIKINAVLQPGANEHEAAELLAWCLERGLELRFIEYMPLDGAGRWNRERMVTADDVWRLLSPYYVLHPVREVRGGAPAEKFDVWPREGVAGPGAPGTIAKALKDRGIDPADTRAVRRVLPPPPGEPFVEACERPGAEALGTVGIIASVTRSFCADCTRTRLTAEGRVRTCLFSHTETDLLGLMRSGASDEAIADRWRAAQWGKQAGHGMERSDFVQPERPMSAIGG